MKRVLLLLCMLLFLALPVCAAEEIGVDTDILEQALPEEAYELMPEITLDDMPDFWSGTKNLLLRALAKTNGSLQSGLRLCAILIGLLTLCAVADMSSVNKFGGAVSAAGALGICAAFVGEFNAMVTMSQNTIQTLSDYSACLLPVLATAAAMSGGMTAAAALHTGTLLFSELLLQLISKLLIPGVFFFLAVATAEAALSSDALKELREFIGWLISKSLRIMLYVFLAFLSLTGVIGGAADAIAVKTTKAAMSGMVPVVGGMISDASETILASASIIKNSIGVFGMIAVLAICILPFLKIGVQYLLLKVTAAISGTVGLKPHVTLLKNFSAAMGYLLAMCGTCSLLLLISGVCFLKVVV
ncbi:MAG: stage III sporulation protein AE [Oscillospiraceae bacterium]|nr:stage III sporulation protein AE [Oscillospiraceae bacterium]